MHRITLESLDTEARAALRSELKAARRTGEALVITGAWDHRGEAADARVADAEYHSLALALLAHPAPVIAVLAGAVTDFGLALAAAADVRVAEAGTTLQITRPGAALETGAYRLLERLLGPAQTHDLVYTGRAWAASDAAASGFLSGATAADADALAERLSAPAGVAVKRAALAGGHAPLVEQLQYDAWLALSAAGEAS